MQWRVGGSRVLSRQEQYRGAGREQKQARRIEEKGREELGVTVFNRARASRTLTRSVDVNRVLRGTAGATREVLVETG